MRFGCGGVFGWKLQSFRKDPWRSEGSKSMVWEEKSVPALLNIYQNKREILTCRGGGRYGNVNEIIAYWEYRQGRTSMWRTFWKYSCRLCSGILPGAQLIKNNAWLLHLIGDEGPPHRCCMHIKSTLLSPQQKWWPQLVLGQSIQVEAMDVVRPETQRAHCQADLSHYCDPSVL